ncbi:DHS-like NAD/FAD-binding domain-containing protein [Bisporella sp. PMI_857]|nr:DHS-like NAD/FAD-binding domain-containing protein [Bisporella sp. PMI_857]
MEHLVDAQLPGLPPIPSKAMAFETSSDLSPDEFDSDPEPELEDTIVTRAGSVIHTTDSYLPTEPVDDADDNDFDDDASDIDSLIIDSMEELRDESLKGGPNTCTLEEAGYYRRLLRSIGPQEFCAQTVESGSVTARKLLTAFGIRPPEYLVESNASDEEYYPFLSLAISRELSKRLKLTNYNTVDDAVELIKKSKNIIVLTGAGISTSLGIPDFRSKNTGLYDQLAHLGLNDPQEVFDIHTFRRDPTIFFSVAKDILPSTKRFTPTHAFIRLLQDKGKLLTNYSQNIDNIEAAAGILPEKLIQCHGSFATASCVECHYKVPGETIYDDIKAGRIPNCERCTSLLQAEKRPRKRKRSRNGQDKKRRRGASGYSTDDDESDDVPQAGVMKPDITFFGEALPDTFSDRLTGHDRDLVDLVIVIGTSLKVAPVSEVVPYLPANIPQMYISMQPVTHVNFDIDLLGECDVVVAEICRRAGWDLKHSMVGDNKLIGIKPQEGFPSRHIFTSLKIEKEASTEPKIRTEDSAETRKSNGVHGPKKRTPPTEMKNEVFEKELEIR